VAVVPEETGAVASKYDGYWATRLSDIRAAVERVVAGLPARVELTGLTDAGERQSWYGVAEVRGREVLHASMAHATSLGRLIAGSAICVNSPAVTFRFVVGHPQPDHGVAGAASTVRRAYEQVGLVGGTGYRAGRPSASGWARR